MKIPEMLLIFLRQNPSASPASFKTLPKAGVLAFHGTWHLFIRILPPGTVIIVQVNVLFQLLAETGLIGIIYYIIFISLYINGNTKK